ncbi:MAG: AI-2E family transporter [Candidatus Nanopelagicales bacterium]|nr:AI-2E family transporter [Candidatus Nanopelagicales bacterium]
MSSMEEGNNSNHLPPWYVKAIWYAIFAVTLSIAAWYIALQLTDLMVTVAICFFLAFSIEPIVNKLAARGWKRGLATLFVYVVGIGAVTAFLVLFGLVFFQQVVDLIAEIPNIYDVIRSFFDETFSITLPEPSVLMDQYLNDAVSLLANGVIGVINTFLGMVFGALTVLLVTFYLVVDGPRFRSVVCSMFSQRRQREILDVWEVAINKTSSYIISRLILALVCGTATTIFLLIVQVPNGLALGIFTGFVSAFIPTIGTYIGGVLPVAVAFGASPIQGVATLAFIVAYQQIENLTIEPRISAKAMELNTAVSFLSVLAGAAVLGPIGAFLALPVAATLKAFVGTYLRRTEVVTSKLTDGGN